MRDTRCPEFKGIKTGAPKRVVQQSMGDTRCPEFKGIKTAAERAHSGRRREISDALNSKGLKLILVVDGVAEGSRYQTRVNAVLRTHMQARRIVR